MLPSVDHARTSKEFREEYKRHIIAEDSDVEEFDRKAAIVEQRLLDAGLEPFRVEAIMDRYVSKLSLQEIADKYGYVSPAAVQHLIKDTLKILKGMGFSIANKLLGSYDG